MASRIPHHRNDMSHLFIENESARPCDPQSVIGALVLNLDFTLALEQIAGGVVQEWLGPWRERQARLLIRRGKV